MPVDAAWQHLSPVAKLLAQAMRLTKPAADQLSQAFLIVNRGSCVAMACVFLASAPCSCGCSPL
eukprot:662689-Lingulodinium_polyedra.AAC.1